MFSSAMLTTSWAYGDSAMRVQHIRKWCSMFKTGQMSMLMISVNTAQVKELVCNNSGVTIWDVCWNGMVNGNCMRHCPLRTWIPPSMFMLHTEMSGGQAQKSILQDFHFTSSWYAKGHPCLLLGSCEMEMHKSGHVCVCFFSFSLCIQTVPDLHKGSVLETFT